MQLNAQQIGTNVLEQIDTLKTKKEELELQLKEQIAAVTAELVALERLTGLRGRPGRKKTNSKADPLIGIAKAVLEAHAGDAFTGTEIAQMAIDTGLWANPPKSSKAKMSRALNKVDSEETNIWQTDDKKFFVEADTE
jgi:hypothetical protein